MVAASAICVCPGGAVAKNGVRDEGRRIGMIDDLKPAIPASKLKGHCGLVLSKAVNELARSFRDIDLDSDLRQLGDPARRELKGLRKALVQSRVIHLSAADSDVQILQLLCSPANHLVRAIGKGGDISIRRKSVARKTFQNFKIT
jgi:hypothetical protein